MLTHPFMRTSALGSEVDDRKIQLKGRFVSEADNPSASEMGSVRDIRFSLYL